MAETLYLIDSPGMDPYYNLALEEYLLSKAKHHTIILYLWQNAHTVVIGRNQNPWVECRTELLSTEGGKLARRLSGGGAVYHDLGNLNFTFVCAEPDYHLQKQLSVIKQACQYTGINPTFSGRNDLLVDGRKFSGNAFYHGNGVAYHHGTLLIDSDMDKLQRYLSPPKAKLESKGITSVRSRVINLTELSPTLSCSAMKQYMAQAFSDIYGSSPQILTLTKEENEIVENLKNKYASEDWLLGKPFPFTCTMENRFSFGSMQLQFYTESNIIQDLQVYTDAMDSSLSQQLIKALQGCPLVAEAMCNACSQLDIAEELCTFFRLQLP